MTKHKPCITLTRGRKIPQSETFSKYDKMNTHSYECWKAVKFSQLLQVFFLPSWISWKHQCALFPPYLIKSLRFICAGCLHHQFETGECAYMLLYPATWEEKSDHGKCIMRVLYISNGTLFLYSTLLLTRSTECLESVTHFHIDLNRCWSMTVFYTVYLYFECPFSIVLNTPEKYLNYFDT